jgi:hypothetical protein
VDVGEGTGLGMGEGVGLKVGATAGVVLSVSTPDDFVGDPPDSQAESGTRIATSRRDEVFVFMNTVLHCEEYFSIVSLRTQGLILFALILRYFVPLANQFSVKKREHDEHRPR